MDDTTLAPPADHKITTTVTSGQTDERTYRLFEVKRPNPNSEFVILKYCVGGGDLLQAIGREDEWYNYPDFSIVSVRVLDQCSIRKASTANAFDFSTFQTKPNPCIEFFNRVVRKIRMESPHLQTWKVEL